MIEYDFVSMRASLLSWHDAAARDLPWRFERDPYKIWLSEIMLQQTRAETVIAYYHRFLAAFPDIRSLAQAELDSVLKLWEGLGYYSRARNLWKAARMLESEFGGVFPDTVSRIRTLPGIGRYTAGAIASIAFQLPEPAIDANQMRVLSRIFAIDTLITSPGARARLESVARSWIDPDRPGDFNQALMGLGALLCLPARFRCDVCPVRESCAARKLAIQDTLPVLPEKTTRRVEHRAVALVFQGDRVLVRKRPEDKLLGGLWEFPHFLDARGFPEVREALEEMGVIVSKYRLGTQAKHVFTHIVWEMRAYLCEADACAPVGARFVTLYDLRQLALPSAMKPFFAEVTQRLEADHAL